MPTDLMLQVQAQEDLGASHFLLTLSTVRDERLSWEPGQFAMITLGEPEGVVDPLLRRPFCIFNLSDGPSGRLQFFYKVMGRGTGLLSRLAEGRTIHCLAPLGNGFTRPASETTRLLLVAGGIGSASLHPLALKEIGAGRRPVVLYGCRTAPEVAGIRPTIEAGAEVRIATDDGTEGHHGTVTDLLDRFLEAEGTDWTICACGPMGMMKTAAAVAKRRGTRCFVSLESSMACGFGVCVGCVVGTHTDGDGPPAYRRICIDGPVFDAEQVVW